MFTCDALAEEEHQTFLTLEIIDLHRLAALPGDVFKAAIVQVEEPARRSQKSDLTRYAKALQAACISEWRVEIDPCGKVSIIASKADAATAGPNPDELL